MNTFQELIRLFNSATASNNEKLLFNAVCALVTVVENQNTEIKRLDNEKQDKELTYS